MDEINNLFGQQQPAAIEINGADALAQLVGEGKKYATVEDMAKGAVNAQQHIGTLEQETATLREQTSAAKGVADVLAAIKGTTQEPVLQQQVADQQPAATNEGLTIAEQIDAAFQARDSKVLANTADTNRKTVINDLGVKYGADAAVLYEQVGRDLGIDLDELAGKSPAAVMKLIADARPAPVANVSQALPTGINSMPQQQQSNGVLNKSAIQALYDAGKINMTKKHQMENQQLTSLGSAAFYK